MTNHGVPDSETFPQHSDGPESLQAEVAHQLGEDSFFEALRGLVGVEAGQSGESEERRAINDRFLNAVAKHSFARVAEQAWRREYNKLRGSPEKMEPARPSEVWSWLSQVRTRPPSNISNIGSLDEAMISELGLTRQNYEEELRSIIKFIDPERYELSVLEFPAAQRDLFARQQRAVKQFLAQLIVEMHGIQLRFDVNDTKSWGDLYALIEDLSSDTLRDYSHHLRDASAQGEHTTIADVNDTIKDMLEMRARAIQIARIGADSPAHERRRMLEPLSARQREMVEKFIEALDEYRDAKEELGDEMPNSGLE